MNLLYDIEQENGELKYGIYFIKYERPIRGGAKNHVISYIPSCVKAFDVSNEVVEVNLKNAKILRIYDPTSMENHTNRIVEQVAKVSQLLGGTPNFPWARRTEVIDD